MSTSDMQNRNLAVSMRKSVENLVISSQDAIGQSISQALTFSGVVTQPTPQNTKEVRNVSRPPSPALLRPSSSGADIPDCDKMSEVGLQVPCGGGGGGGGGDTVSVSSASDVSISAMPITLRNENPKAISPNLKSAEGPGGGAMRAKKKSWYNALYPTYKSKSEDFKRLFKDIPDDERLIVDYSCALQKDILVHGRLYASQHYLCFYASIFGWETSLSLRWKDVTAITKEKTALVIPNAILVCTEGEKNFLTSFSGRDKAYLMLFRIWQNALMDQPITSQEIWQWVHTCYGEELGFNSDEEGYPRDLPEDAAPALLAAAVCQELGDTSSMEACGAAEGRDEQRASRSASRGRDSSPPLVANGDADYLEEEEGGDTLPTDMSDSSDSEPDKPHGGAGEADKCTESHEGRLFLQQEFPFTVDQLFTMIFTNSKFNVELLAGRGIRDYVQAQWQTQTGLKCRQVNYTQQITSGPIGPKEVYVTETQVMNKCSKPGVLYSINASSENAGIPYADYFTVEVHYCLRRAGGRRARLLLVGGINYKKNMWAVIRSFVEKNTMDGLEEFARLLEARLASEAAACVAPAARQARRRRRHGAQSIQETIACAAALPPAVGAGGASGAGGGRGAGGGARGGGAGAAGRAGRGGGWLAALLLALLALNALLYWRLYHHHHHHHHDDAQRRALDMQLLHDKMSSATEGQLGAWAQLLQRHTRQQRGQLLAWRAALQRAVAHLAQTEQALAKLLETIKPSLEQAQAQAQAEGAPRDDL